MKLLLFVIAHTFLHLSESITIDDEIFINLVNIATNLQQQVQELKNDLPNQISQLQRIRCKTPIGDLQTKLQELETKQNTMPQEVMTQVREVEKVFEYVEKESIRYFQFGATYQVLGGLKESVRLRLKEINANVDGLPPIISPNLPLLEGITSDPGDEDPKRVACINRRIEEQGYQILILDQNDFMDDNYMLHINGDGRFHRLTSKFPNLDYETADKYCKSIGAHLPYIKFKTAEERASIMRSLYLTRTFFWVGLTDRDEEGVWKWEDGTIADKEAVGFADDQPSGVFEGDGKTKENCIYSFPDSSKSYLNDVVCDWSIQDLTKYDEENSNRWYSISFGSAIVCEFDCYEYYLNQRFYK